MTWPLITFLGVQLVLATAFITKVWARARSNSHRIDTTEETVAEIRKIGEKTNRDVAEINGYLKGIHETVTKLHNGGG